MDCEPFDLVDDPPRCLELAVCDLLRSQTLARYAGPATHTFGPYWGERPSSGFTRTLLIHCVYGERLPVSVE
jgi:hypothetical protein